MTLVTSSAFAIPVHHRQRHSPYRVMKNPRSTQRATAFERKESKHSTHVRYKSINIAEFDAVVFGDDPQLQSRQVATVHPGGS
jgi:hypothetical protein